jgi:hypothetical protein
MRHLLCFVVLALGVCASAGGQTVEVSILRAWARMSKTPLGSSSPSSPDDHDTTFRNGYSNGLRLTWNPHRYFGYELGYLQTHVTLRAKIQASKSAPKETYDRKVTLHQAFFDFLVYWMPKNERWRPYVVMGAQAQQSPNPHDIPDWTGTATRNYGFHYGMGLKLKLFSHAELRLDGRDSWTGKPYDLSFVDMTQAGGYVRQQEASVGIGFTF